MITLTRSKLVRFSETAFSLNFIAFSFVMFSCFPTGFSATFSTFAFIFALPLFFYRVGWENISLFEKIGLVLFMWLGASILWSQSGVLVSLGYLSEYRLYFMVPVFTTALLCVPNTLKWAFIAAVTGAVVALIISYGLSLEWWQIEGATLSLADRIYHGFIMSALLLVALVAARDTSGMFRISAAVLAALTAYNVLNIETGRTGFLQLIVVGFAFTFLSVDRLKTKILAVMVALSPGIGYLTLEKFNSRVDETWANIVEMIERDEIAYTTSTGQRLEFYRVAIQFGADSPISGVGVGDVAAELADSADRAELRVATDNVHSEFLNMLMAGGVPALFLFLAFVLSIGYVGFQHRKTNWVIGDALIGISSIVFVSALFNSTIKDYGEKHALLIILSILSAELCRSRESRSDDTIELDRA